MPYLNDKMIVFTDLDEYNQSCRTSTLWLERLMTAHVPVILSTKKTSAEISSLHHELELLPYPFIAEQGAIVKTPAEWLGFTSSHHLLGRSYQDIRHILVNLRRCHHFDFSGFGDVSVKQVADWSGLTSQQAMLAMQREASELIVWHGDPATLPAFEQHLAKHQLRLLPEGRFFMVMGQSAGKEHAVRWLTQQYQQRLGQHFSLSGGNHKTDLIQAIDFTALANQSSQDDMADILFTTNNMVVNGWSDGPAQIFSH
jgi:mannosyl-3-phosphoglycerate phosphatase